MLIRRKHTVIGVVTAYGFLIMLVFVLKKSNPVNVSCSWMSPCVSFCCQNTKFCNDTVIKKSFTMESDGEFYDKDDDFTPLYGKPSCSLKPIGHQKWSFYIVSGLIEFETSLLTFCELQYGYIKIGNFKLEQSDYCFQESTDKDVVTWDLLTCLGDHHNRFYFSIASEYINLVNHLR